MKVSNWQFKKSPNFNVLGLSALAILVFLNFLNACQSKPTVSQKPVDKLLVFQEIKHESQTLALFSKSSCEDSSKQTWLINFASDLGSHQVQIDYKNAPESSIVKIGHQSFIVDLEQPLAPQNLQTICQQQEATPVELEAFRSLQGILEKVVPSCQFETRNHELFCKLEAADPKASLERIDSLHKQLLNRWQRHAYLLTRRFSYTRKLAMALDLEDDGAFQQKVEGLCKLAQASLPEELPLATRSPRWFQQVCLSKKAGAGRQALAISVSQAISELEALSEKLRQSSRSGTLHLRIPSDLAPGRDYWLSLQSLVSADGEEASSNMEAIFACWHPLYQQSLIELSIAQTFTQAEKPCLVMTPMTEKHIEVQVERYIRNSIASETEFAISNGRGKILRLPEGDYSYELTLQTEDFEEDSYQGEERDASMLKSRGSLTWKGRRPQPVIRAWKQESSLD